MTIQHIWSCKCGAETPCQYEDVEIGAVFQCPACKVIWGRLRCKVANSPSTGWIEVSPEDAEWHGFLETSDGEQQMSASQVQTQEIGD